MGIQDVKEKLIFIGLLTGIFLPIRLFFNAYFSEYWLGSLGLISLLVITLVILINKKKLGIIGKIFEKQIRKAATSKTLTGVLITSMFFLVYFGGTLILIERGNNLYSNDKNLFFTAITDSGIEGIESLSIDELMGPTLGLSNYAASIAPFSNLEYVLSITYGLMDGLTDGWLSHLHFILMVEQIEIIGLLFFFKLHNRPLKTPSIQKYKKFRISLYI